MGNKTLEDFVKENRIAIDDYENSVTGLYAFSRSACWDETNKQFRPESKYCIPRTMESITNKNKLTPDGVTQVTNDYGIISEMKKHFRESDSDNFEQLQKYDQDLKGWWNKNETIKNHDLVLLTHYFSSTTAKDSFQAWLAKNKNYERKFAIIEFTFSDGAQEYFALKTVFGNLTDNEHNEHLRKGKKINTSLMIDIFTKYKFYDSKPPLIHMLVTLHDYIFVLIDDEWDIDEKSGKVLKTKVVSLEKLQELTKEQFIPMKHTSRQPNLPKPEWIKEAMDKLVEMHLAQKLERSNYRITIKKPTKKDTIEFYSLRLFQLLNKKNKKAVKNNDQGELSFSEV